MRFFIIASFIFLVSNHNLKADLAGEMSDFWGRSTGGVANVNSATFYKSQAGGNIMSLGSLYARTQTKNYNLSSFQLPSARVGCGGIDLFAGSFSFINADQFIAIARAIASNASGFAFKLALATISPMIDEQMSGLMDLIQKLNLGNLNSCEAAKNAVAFAWSDQNAQMNDYICREIGTNSGLFSDYVRSRRGCGNENQRNSVNKSDPDSAQTVQINFTWEGLKKSNVFNNDYNLMQAMQGLVCTDIINNEVYSFKTPLIFDQNNIKALVEGGQVNIYQCDEFSLCLNVNQAVINIDSSTAFLIKVKTLLQEVYTATLNDSRISNNAIALIDTTSLPIYSMIKTMVFAKIPIEQLDSINQIVAYDLIYGFLEENL